MGQHHSQKLPEGVTMADAQAEAKTYGFASRQALEDYFTQIIERRVKTIDMEELADKLKTTLLHGLSADSLTPTSLALRRLLYV